MVEVALTIASGGTTSAAFDFRQWSLLQLRLPAMTGATISFLASDEEDGTFAALYDDAGNQITITATDSVVVAVTDSAKSLAVASCAWLKLVSASAEAAERSIVAVCKKA